MIRVVTVTAPKIFRTLEGSVASIHAVDPQIHTRLSYRQLCRRLAVRSRQRLGIGAARKITDKCRACTIWDSVVSKRSRKQIRDSFSVLEGLLADYWAGSEAWRERLEGIEWRSKNFQALQAYADVKALADFVSEKATTDRSGMDEGSRDALSIAEATVIDLMTNPQGILAALSEHGMHWRLRDYLRDTLKKDMSEPAENTIYLYEDFLD